MRLPTVRAFGFPWTLRRLVRDLGSLRTEVARLADGVERIADRLAPRPPPDRRPSSTDAAVSHLDVEELALAQAYIDRVEREQAYTPSEEEVLTYLADEKTVELHARLRARAAEIGRRES